MDWKKLSPEEKVELLKQQLDDIQRAQALLTRFERLTKRWLRNAQDTQKRS